MFLIPALGRERKVDLWKFQASLVCIGSFRTVRTTQRPCFQKTKNNFLKIVSWKQRLDQWLPKVGPRGAASSH